MNRENIYEPYTIRKCSGIVLSESCRFAKNFDKCLRHKKQLIQRKNQNLRVLPHCLRSIFLNDLQRPIVYNF